MAFLDDQNGRPVQQKFLDLLSLKPQLKEEVQNALYKIPELKLRPEKIPEEEDVVKPHSWKNLSHFPYLDAVPSSMLHVDIRELSAVEIDWKMLTLERPETALEIQIFSRMVYLDKLMMKCIIQEKSKKEKEKFIRLRTKGRWKPPSDSDVDKSDEFTYEYFSRLYGGTDRGPAMEEVPKTAAEEPKPRVPPPTTDAQQVNKTPIAPPSPKTKRRRVKKSVRKTKRKKKRRKTKLRKRKLTTKPKSKQERKRKKFVSSKPFVSSLRRKPKIRKAVTIPRKKTVPTKEVKKKSDSNKTLVQMLKAKEQQDKRKGDSSVKP